MVVQIEATQPGNHPVVVNVQHNGNDPDPANNSTEIRIPVSDTTTVTWSTRDADGDPLQYTVCYSGDGGATWRGLATDLETTDFVLDAAEVGGSEGGLVEVIASDGFHAGRDRSDGTFLLPTQPPSAWILSPGPEDGVAPGSGVYLEGFGVDAEDGVLPDGSLAWRSDLDGMLGTGSALQVEGLSPGLHRIRLAVTDGEQKSASQSVYLAVAVRSYLPLVSR